MIPQINYHMIQVLKPFQVWLRIQDVHHTGWKQLIYTVCSNMQACTLLFGRDLKEHII
jgi:hypothetical protein